MHHLSTLSALAYGRIQKPPTHSKCLLFQLLIRTFSYFIIIFFFFFSRLNQQRYNISTVGPRNMVKYTSLVSAYGGNIWRCFNCSCFVFARLQHTRSVVIILGVWSSHCRDVRESRQLITTGKRILAVKLSGEPISYDLLW